MTTSTIDLAEACGKAFVAEFGRIAVDGYARLPPRSDLKSSTLMPIHTKEPCCASQVRVSEQSFSTAGYGRKHGACSLSP